MFNIQAWLADKNSPLYKRFGKIMTPYFMKAFHGSYPIETDLTVNPAYLVRTKRLYISSDVGRLRKRKN